MPANPVGGMMRAARLHAVGEPMRIEQVARPTLAPTDVLVKVEACNLVPNLSNILENWVTWFPYLPLPQLPAVFGLDSAGVVAAVGEGVQHFAPGDRVYVNPGLSCGSCDACLRSAPIDCADYTFMGYFGFGPGAQNQYDRYAFGGLSEFLSAPQANLVRLPDNVSAAQAARFGYLGTAYAALKKARVGPQSQVLVLGGTGTLGLGAVLLALALGVRRVLVVARDRDLLAAVRALAPERISTFSTHDGVMSDWVAGETRARGVDAVINCLGPGSDPAHVGEALSGIRRGGKFVNVSGVAGPVPIDIFRLMCANVDLVGSNWFTVSEAEEMAALAETGALELSVFEQQTYPLHEVNDALRSLPTRRGGFTSFIVAPTQGGSHAD